MKKEYSFKDVNNWYNTNKVNILKLAGYPNYKSIYSQVLEKFNIPNDVNLTDVINTITFDNL